MNKHANTSPKPASLPWYLVANAWECPADQAHLRAPFAELSTTWKLLLLSDGSVTRHLQLLTGEPTTVDVLSMTAIGMDGDGAPACISEIPGPRLRRQVVLHNQSGQRLAYAASWWQEDEVNTYLRDKALPIWVSLASQKAELFRDIRQLFYGESAALDELFGSTGPYWGRYYFFWHDQRPLTLIYEVFSPAIQEYLNADD